MVNLKENSGALAILFVGIMLLSSYAVGAMSRRGISLAPISLYQGIHPSFEAVYYKNNYYTTADPGEATSARIGPATLNFDPDGPVIEMANIVGELRDIQIVRDISYYTPTSTYQHIVTDFGGEIQPDAPYRVYEWEVPEGEDKHVYRMELWLCSLQVNAWISPDPRPWWALFRAYEWDTRYTDTELWLKLEASNSWGTYFEDVNVSNVYFGILYSELAELESSEFDSRLQVLPASQWSAMDLYYSLGGGAETPQSPTSQAFQYQGATLNEAVFRKEWYTKLTLKNFGTYDVNLLDGSYKADMAQWRILVHVVVVGDWLVKPDLERDLEDPDPPFYTGPLQSLIEGIRNFFNDPMWRFKLAIIATVFIFLGILFFFPWVIPMVRGATSSLMDKRRPRK
jgi:hypothetical protein